MAPPGRIVLDALDGVRGLSSVLIVVGHFFTFWVVNDPLPIFGLEYLSIVSLFFVISGYTLAVIYDAGPPNEDGQPSPPRSSAVDLSTKAGYRLFLRKRVARLAPVYYLSLAVGIAPYLIYFPDPVNLAIGAPFTLFALQSISMLGLNWDGPLWTVSSFVMCYLMFPFFLRRFSPLSTRALRVWWWSLAVTCVASSVVVPFGGGFVHFIIVWRLPQFLLGVLTAQLANREPVLRPAIVAEICSTLLLANFIGAAVVSYYSGYAAWLTYMLTMEFVVAPIQAVWVSALTAPLPTPIGPTRALFLTPPMRFLGNISYAMYASHWVVIIWCAWAVAGGISADLVPFYSRLDKVGSTFDDGWYYFPAWAVVPILAVCIAFATGMWALVERPARQRISGAAAATKAAEQASFEPLLEVDDDAGALGKAGGLLAEVA